MVILFLTGCFSESINKRISRSLGIEIPKDIKIEYEDTHGGFHGDGETVAVVEFNNSIGEDIQWYLFLRIVTMRWAIMTVTIKDVAKMAGVVNAKLDSAIIAR